MRREMAGLLDVGWVLRKGTAIRFHADGGARLQIFQADGRGSRGPRVIVNQDGNVEP